MKRGRKITYWAIGILVFIVLGIVVWFSIPFSPMKSEFSQLKDNQISERQPSGQVFTIEDIAELPAPLQKYFESCGYINKPKMFNIKINHNDVDFILNDKALKITCVQFNSGEMPDRIALIDTSLYGVPFEGLDVYQNGSGSMKGMLAKSIVLFNQTGDEMNQSSLVNCLAESLLVPSIALQDFIVWEEVDESSVKGTISYYGVSVSGTFTFDENGYLTTFTTDDRIYVDTNGNAQQVQWSAICGDYREVNGIMQPKTLKAIWHLSEGDLVYFDGHETVIEYNVTG
ncbi:MAG: hypothetical protein PHV71_08455 [Eubacteriales bacterium]|nr:hypothetical protein [Eubacteriales bacterium]MDD4630592.1 hypothetical protein [Eubacteriales bacterium]